MDDFTKRDAFVLVFVIAIVLPLAAWLTIVAINHFQAGGLKPSQEVIHAK
jgi:hypothetical protein